MTATELKSSIMSDLNAMGVDLLEVVARYVRELNTSAVTTDQTDMPRKLQLSDRISRLRGKFSIPANTDVREMVADHLTEKHVAG